MDFKKLGITFKEKAFYDILTEVRDSSNPPVESSDVKCKELTKKTKELIGDTAAFADWLNSGNFVRTLLSP